MPRDERGLTLVEVTIATVLASLVLMGLAGFYLSAQATWLESSTRAVTQRDGTFALERMTGQIRAASGAIALASPKPQQMKLFLYDASGAPSWHYWWEPSDSTLHHGPGDSEDHGALIGSRVDRFEVQVIGGTLVDIAALHLVSPTGEIVELSSAAAIYNR